MSDWKDHKVPVLRELIEEYREAAGRNPASMCLHRFVSGRCVGCGQTEQAHRMMLHELGFEPGW